MALSKVLNLREQEKKDAQIAYRESMEIFEEVATKLYTILRKKEDAEKSYDAFLADSISLEKIREQMAYIESLNRQIVDLQATVQKARESMESKQLKLTDAHVEVKKFESVIEHRRQAAEELAQKVENESMDAISIQQHISYKNR